MFHIFYHPACGSTLESFHAFEHTEEFPCISFQARVVRGAVASDHFSNWSPDGVSRWMWIKADIVNGHRTIDYGPEMFDKRLIM